MIKQSGADSFNCEQVSLKVTVLTVLNRFTIDDTVKLGDKDPVITNSLYKQNNIAFLDPNETLFYEFIGEFSRL